MTKPFFYPQIHTQYRDFLKALHYVNSYAVDLSADQKKDITNGIEFEISQEEFFEQLYEDRIGLEDAIIDDLIVGSKQIVILGALGSGKTSLGLRIKSTLQRLGESGYHVTFVDIRTKVFQRFSELANIDLEETIEVEDLYNATELEELGDKLIRELMEKIKNRYLIELFPNEEDENGINQRINLIAFLLEDNNKNLPDIYDFLNDERFEASLMYKRYQSNLSNRRENTSYYEWLIDTSAAHKEVHELVTRTHKKITASLLAYAANYLHEYKHQFIWIDNIDWLPEKQQEKVNVVLKNIYGRIRPIASVIFALREQNVYKEYDLDEKGAPPFQTTVKLYTPEQDSTNAREIGVLSSQQLDGLISKRLIFARDLQKREYVKITEDILGAQNKLNSSGNTKREKLRLESVIGLLQKKKSIIGKPISDERFGYCQQISQKLVDQYKRLDIPCFANGSIRNLLILHTESLGYLLSKPKLVGESDKKVPSTIIPNAIDYNLREVATLYLIWARERSEENNPVNTYDIVANTEAWFSENRNILGCLLEYLIIAGVWNLTLSKPQVASNTFGIPTIGEITEKLSLLGYSEDQIKNAIFNLYDIANRDGLVEVQLQNTSHLTDISKIKDHHLISVTPRGKCLIANLGNTFGYTYACVRAFENATKEKKKQALKEKWHTTIETSEAILSIIPTLCDIAELHIVALETIRERNPFDNEKWLDEYRKAFGIPLGARKSRGALAKAGKRVGKIRRSLQFEALIAGIIPFADGKPRNQLLLIESIYKERLNDLENNKLVEELSIRSKLGIAKRND